MKNLTVYTKERMESNALSKDAKISYCYIRNKIGNHTDKRIKYITFDYKITRYNTVGDVIEEDNYVKKYTGWFEPKAATSSPKLINENLKYADVTFNTISVIWEDGTEEIFKGDKIKNRYANVFLY